MIVVSFVILVIVSWYFSKTMEMVKSAKSEKIKEEQNNNQIRYKNAFKKLSDDQIKRLHNCFYGIMRSTDVDQAPLELYSAGLAIGEIEKEGGTGIAENNSDIESIVNHSIMWMEAGVKSAGIVMRNAEEKGLGFGIITNSAADMALYSAMDARERNKNIKAASNDLRLLLKKEVLSLVEKFLAICGVSTDSFCFILVVPT